ncbi:MAG: magnesium transporter CorA family protein [Lachnospiraceae bacterium]|nr:magnesium transporter CorA family protein [Lachnospiraceae bacterium]
MLNYYISEDRTVKSLEAPAEGCWVSLINPTVDEVSEIAAKFDIDVDDLRSALDTDERSRIQTEDNYTMILVNIPTIEDDTENELYDTIPLAVFVCKKTIITVCLEETPILSVFAEGRVRDFNTAMKSRFVMQILYKNASLFLLYLRSIEKKSETVEDKLHKATQNSELLELLKLQKSLVYFTTSLRSNELVMEKLFKNERFKKYPEDEDLLEDVIIENKQAIEMANIYTGIIGGMTDSFASIISNNMNVVMKTLAIITIVLSVPTMIYSAYGMNVAAAGMPFSRSEYGFLIIVAASLVLSIIVAIAFIKMKMFK